MCPGSMGPASWILMPRLRSNSYPSAHDHFGASVSIRVHQAHTVAELSQHADAWDDLAATSPDQLPMLSHAWVASFVEYNLRPDQTWRCSFAYDGDDLVGVLPITRLARRGLIGARLQATFDLHTRSGYALLAEGKKREALSALLDSLSEVEPDYLWLRFCGIRNGSPVLTVADHLSAVRVETMRASGLIGSVTGSVLSVRGRFEDYEARLASNFRRNLRKARNRCDREYESSYRFVTGSDATSTNWLRTFLELEATGWKGQAGSAINCVPRLINFYEALAQRLGDRGWLEWHFLELDGVAVAGQLGIRCGRSLVLQKIAYDESYGRLGPGSLLFRETVARSFVDAGVDEINCISDTPWHRNWHMQTNVYSDMVVTPRRLLPILAGLIEVEGPQLIRRAVVGARAATKKPTFVRGK